MVVLDTSVIIDHLRNRRGTDSYLKKIYRQVGYEVLCVSVLTLQELYEGKSTKEEAKLKDMLAVLAPLKVIDYNPQVAEIAGTISRDLKAPVEFVDAAIAATCIFNNYELATFNTRDFEKIPNLSIFQLF